MKKSIVFYLLSTVPFLAGFYDLYVGGTDGLLEASALFILALVFVILGSTFYIGHRLKARVSVSDKSKVTHLKAL